MLLLYNVRCFLLLKWCTLLSNQTLLSAEQLAFERDDRVLFENLNLSVRSGDIVQVAGPNGAGKTTLLRVLARSLTPNHGELRWCGKPVRQCATVYTSNLLYLGHQSGIKAVLTPEENLGWMTQTGLTRTDCTISEALKKVGLAGYEDVPCYSLSAGQHRRVALARLHLSGAALWILDEPFTAIDKQGVAELEQLICQHAERGGAVILTTHQPLSIGSVRTLELAA